MRKLIALDDGHGMQTAGKRTPMFKDGNFMHENEFNRAVVDYLDVELIRCGFDTLLTAGGSQDNTDVPLATRVGRANNTLKNVYNRPVDLLISIHANAYDGVWGEENPKDPRGIETLIQLGLSDSTNTYKYAVIIHKWLMKGVVMVNRGVKRQDLYICRETTMPAILVECGFMDNLHDALLLVSDTYRRECATELAQAVCEIYGVKYIPSTTTITPPLVADPSNPTFTALMGESRAVAEQMVNYVKKTFPTYKLGCTLEDLVALYLSEGAVEGMRGDLLFAQAVHETNGFRYGGIVLPEYHNYCGMGALDGNSTGQAHQFKNPQEGVRGHVQHAVAYANKLDLKNPIVDPRFKYVERGVAPYLEWLSIPNNPNNTAQRKYGWASDKDYAVKVLKHYNLILGESFTPPVVVVTPPTTSSSTPQWQIDMFKQLVSEGKIKSPEFWEDKVLKQTSLTAGEVMALLVACIK